MKPKIFDCHKFASPGDSSQLCLLLSAASTSIFWVLAVTQPTFAQASFLNQQTDNSQFDTAGLLPVPKLPAASDRTTSGLPVVPPPGESLLNPEPTATNNFAASGFAVKQGLPSTQNINQLENSFINQGRQRQTSKSKSSPALLSQTAIQSRQPNPGNPSAMGGDSVDADFSNTGLGLRSQVNRSSTSTSTKGQLNAQAAPLSNFGTPTTQEFTAPGTPPTFNQLLNNSQSGIAPLPPLVGETPQPQFGANATPTFNQLLNASTTTPGSIASGSVPTFNQLLNNPQAANSGFGQTSANNVAASEFERILNTPLEMRSPFPIGDNSPSFNQILNSPLGTQSSLVESTPPTFNQIFNSQGGSLPSPNDPQIQSQLPTNTSQRPATERGPIIKSTALSEPSLRLQGVYVTQDETSARARLTGTYPLTPQALFGATLDLVSDGSTFDDSRNEGLNINELYFATSLAGLPNLRFVIGQMDLTSYFDRNSFAKDGASQFFNPVFQTNPALSATGISSRPGLLVNWSVTDNIDAKAAVFSSANSLSNFALDGFAGEVGVRFGNAIVRGTYSTARDAGNRDTFPESFSLARGDNRFGILRDDREEAYGLNAEVFVPNLKLGLFGRYGRYENRDLGRGADTYVLGATLLDLFTADDRLGLAYGQALTNDSLRRTSNRPDVVELYYDFPLLENLRLGFTVQGRDSFEETVLGVRVKTEFDVTPRGRVAR
ncbi:porin [Calothrix sp. UHCC 0171]|uniref:porin n=1 Tax=Calothrix sp. UHCC 0171 TaxID=3110245 RepID=UPI002B1F7471|nr:porin [Calothrix sp. UHCC 0171]MEA5570126.1 porin [Calothrix sp. UHCC 0171]